MKKIKIALSIFIVMTIVGGVIVGAILLGGQKKSNRVVVTIFPVYEIAREIMGSDDEITLLMDSGVDLHSYNPTAQDIVTIAESELFIYIGGHSDKWVANVMASVNNVNLKTLELITTVDTLEDSDENIVQPNPNHGHHHGDEHEEDEHEHDDEHENEGDGHGHHNHDDEHIWMSLKNMIVMTNAVLENLIDVYPERTAIFKENALEYTNKLTALDERYRQEVAGSEKSLLIADRFPFRYLTHDYGIGYHSAFSGCSTETNASPDTITSLITTINNQQISYVLILESSTKELANTLINGSNYKDSITILVVHSCQSIDEKDLGKHTYLNIMENNLNQLKKALN